MLLHPLNDDAKQAERPKKVCWSCHQPSDRPPGSLCSRCDRHARFDAMAAPGRYVKPPAAPPAQAQRPTTKTAEQAERPTTEAKRLETTMEAKYYDDLPDDTFACLDPRHDEPCVGACSGCDTECNPAFRTTLADVRRRAEIDLWLEEVGAQVIQVQNLEAALASQDWGQCAIERFTGGKSEHYFLWWCWTAAHHARAALGEA